MHDSTDSPPLTSVCGSAKRHLTLRVYWPGPILPQLQWPSDQPSFASQFMNFEAVWTGASRWWTAGTGRRETARVGQGSASCLISNEGRWQGILWAESVGGCWMNQGSSALMLLQWKRVSDQYAHFKRGKKKGESVSLSTLNVELWDSPKWTSGNFFNVLPNKIKCLWLKLIWKYVFF